MERLPWDEWLRALGLERARFRPGLAHLRPQMAKAYRLLRAAARLGVPGSVAVPPELLPIGARALAQGYLNRFALTLLNDWLLPKWMREQADPRSPTFVPRSVVNIMVNQTARNWTALGIPGEGHRIESIVDRWGLLTPVPGGPSLDWWVQVDGGREGSLLLAASEQKEVVQRLQGGTLAEGGAGLTLPVVATAFEAGGLRVSSEAWMLAAHDADWAVMQVVLFNIADVRVRGRFYFALRPYNPEGISPVYHISWDGQTLRADERPGPVTWPAPQGWALSGLKSGDLFSLIRRHEQPEQVDSLHDPHGFAHGVLQYTFSIEPWEEAEFIAFVPVHSRAARTNGAKKLFPLSAKPSTLSPQPSSIDSQFYSRAKAATTLAWRELLGCGMRITVPDRDLQESWEANHAHLLALHDGREITPGPDIYHTFWFRDAAYMAHALSVCGYAEATAELLRGFPRRQRLSGVFVSQQGEWDSTGQALWAIARHLSLHPDDELRAELMPSVDRGVRWIMRTLSRSPDGLMPPGISSEHLGPPDRYYWDNLWSLAGLEAARELIGPNRALEEAAARLRHTLTALWQADAQRIGRPCIPAAPGRGVDIGAVGSLAAWFPLELLPPDSPLLYGTLQALQEVAFHDGMLFVGTGHSGWGTYLNMRIAGCYLMQGQEGVWRGWQIMHRLLRYASPTRNWPEAIHPVSKGGSAGDGQHGWASAEWLLLVRRLLFHDSGGVLVLTPAFPVHWLEKPGEVTVKNAPTAFGPVSYHVSWQHTERGAEQAVCLRLQGMWQWRIKPPRIRWHLPGTVLSVSGDARQATFDRHSVLLSPDAEAVEATIAADWQKTGM
jgi:hypothetical protein